MPLVDRPEFLSWLENRTANLVGRRHGDTSHCDICGLVIDHDLSSLDCLVCLAEQFGSETAERHVTSLISQFILQASDPIALHGLIVNARSEILV